jgi:hypothetical protein
MNRTSRRSLSIALCILLTAGAAVPAQAGNVRNSSRTNVNVNKNVNKNVNIDRDRNVNVNRHRDVDVDIDVDHHGGCCYHDDHHHNPIATAAAVTATAVITSAIVGSIVYSIPPNCSTVIINGFAYQQCGSTWYQPQISGGSTTYIVVNPPR